MNINQLSKRRYKEILSSIMASGLQTTLSKTKNIKSVSPQRGELIIINNEPSIVYVRGFYIPFIGALNKFQGYKKVYVDKGAVKYLINGADVMRPGIVKWEEFDENDVIIVYVEKYDAPLLVGKALVSSKKLKEMEKGKVILNLHHIGDEFWKTSQNLLP